MSTLAATMTRGDAVTKSRCGRVAITIKSTGITGEGRKKRREGNGKSRVTGMIVIGGDAIRKTQTKVTGTRVRKETGTGEIVIRPGGAIKRMLPCVRRRVAERFRIGAAPMTATMTAAHGIMVPGGIFQPPIRPSCARPC